MNKAGNCVQVSMAEDCAEISVETSWTLYLLRCADGSLYTGITTDLQRRLQEHNGELGNSRGAKSLRGRQPLTVAYQLPVASKSIGLQLEYRIKQLRRKDKERLVLGALDPASLIPGEAVAASDSPRSRTTTDKPDSEQS
jgi:putative endonuclease